MTRVRFGAAVFSVACAAAATSSARAIPTSSGPISLPHTAQETPPPTPRAEPQLIVVGTPQSSVVVVDRGSPAQPPGTHFLVEGYAGGTVMGGYGGYGSLRLGAGGKPPSIPWRFYLVGEIAYSTATSEGSVPRTGESFDEGRRWLDLAMGVRIYVPVVEPVRFFADILGGASWGTAWIERPGAPRIEPDGWNGLLILGAGIQVRVTEEMSLGARLALRLTGDPLSDLRAALGLENLTPITASGGATWHW